MSQPIYHVSLAPGMTERPEEKPKDCFWKHPGDVLETRVDASVDSGVVVPCVSYKLAIL